MDAGDLGAEIIRGFGAIPFTALNATKIEHLITSNLIRAFSGAEFQSMRDCLDQKLMVVIGCRVGV